MKIEVDFDRCSASAVCAGLYPEVFEVRGDVLHILREELPEDARDLVDVAVRSCPTQALSIVDG